MRAYHFSEAEDSGLVFSSQPACYPLFLPFSEFLEVGVEGLVVSGGTGIVQGGKYGRRGELWGRVRHGRGQLEPEDGRDGADGDARAEKGKSDIGTLRASSGGQVLKAGEGRGWTSGTTLSLPTEDLIPN